MKREAVILLPATRLLLVALPVAAQQEATDGVVSSGEYSGGVEFEGGIVSLHWRVDGELIHLALVGRTEGWVALGIEAVTAMRDADMLFGWVEADGKARIFDCYSTGVYGPHPPDTELGGTEDILERAGIETGGVTTLAMLVTIVLDLFQAGVFA